MTTYFHIISRRIYIFFSSTLPILLYFLWSGSSRRLQAEDISSSIRIIDYFRKTILGGSNQRVIGLDVITLWGIKQYHRVRYFYYKDQSTMKYDRLNELSVHATGNFFDFFSGNVHRLAKKNYKFEITNEFKKLERTNFFCSC